MPDTVEKVAERLARLESTVAKGFFENSQRFDRLDGRMDQLDGRMDRLERRMTALDNKLDVSVDSLRSDIKTVLDGVTSLADETRRGFDSMRKEHAADREVFKLALLDHGTRIQALEELSRRRAH